MPSSSIYSLVRFRLLGDNGVRFWFKRREPKPIVKMVTPGRRAYGEDWQEVTIAVDEAKDEIAVTDSRPTEAPPRGTPIYVNAFAEHEVPMVDFLLEGARKQQEYGLKNPRDMSDEEYAKWIQQVWLDYCEQKLMWFKGQTTLGPGGFYQRESPY